MTDRFVLGSWSRAALLCLALSCCVWPASRPAAAAMGADAAASAADANQGLNACSSNAGKVLYECVANVLDRLASHWTPREETARALRAAAAGLRVAVNKVQALSAIAQCRSAIAGALRLVKTSAEGFAPGWGGAGLNSVASVLAHATQLIQTKG